MKISAGKILVPLGVSGILLVALAQLTDWHSIGKAIRSVPLRFVLFSFGCAALLNWVRAKRYQLLTESKTLAAGHLFPIVCLQNMLNNLMPMRSGEISYVYLVRKYYAVRVSEAIGALFLVRLFDIVMLLFAFTISVGLLGRDIGWNMLTILFLMVAGASLAILALCYPVALWSVGRSTWRMLTQAFQCGHTNWAQRIALVLEQAATTVGLFHRRREIFIQLWIYSLFILLNNYTVFVVLLLAFPVFLPLPKILMCVTVAAIANLLSISIAGLGTMEGGWASSLAFSGISVPTAVAMGVVLHLFQVLFASLLGILGWIMLWLTKYLSLPRSIPKIVTYNKPMGSG